MGEQEGDYHILNAYWNLYLNTVVSAFVFLHAQIWIFSELLFFFFVDAGKLRHQKQWQSNAGGLDIAIAKSPSLSENPSTQENELKLFLFLIYGFLPGSKHTKLDSQGPTGNKKFQRFLFIGIQLQ